MAHHTKQRWSAADDARMRAEFPHTRTADLARSMGRSLNSVRSRGVILGLQKTPDTLRHINASRDNHGNNAGRFQHGKTPWNKGASGYHLPHGAPIGTERERGGYRERKVCMDGPHWRRWRFVHVLLWEQERGPVPLGYVVAFRDGDASHIALDNLCLITQAENLARVSVHTYGPELFQLMQLRGAITRQLNKRKAKA